MERFILLNRYLQIPVFQYVNPRNTYFADHSNKARLLNKYGVSEDYTFWESCEEKNRSMMKYYIVQHDDLVVGFSLLCETNNMKNIKFVIRKMIQYDYFKKYRPHEMIFDACSIGKYKIIKYFICTVGVNQFNVDELKNCLSWAKHTNHRKLIRYLKRLIKRSNSFFL